MSKKSTTKSTTSIELALATRRGALYEGDCLQILPLIKDDSIDCIFADPPFNLGKSYGVDHIDDQLPEDRYLQWTQQWVDECIRILKPGGSLFIYHIPKWLITIGAHLNMRHDLEFRHWIAVKMKNGFPRRNHLHPAHYGLLYYVKLGAPFKFHVQRSPSPICRHCGNLLRDYGGYRSKYKKTVDGVPLIQLADFWEDTGPNIHHKSRPKNINELPLVIPTRAILISTNKGDLVLDPFAGGGSTLQAAEINSRYWIGCELASTEYASDRIITEANACITNNIPTKLHRIFAETKVEMTKLVV